LGLEQDEVRALLDGTVLLDRVLSVDQTKLKELVTDEEVALEIRNKLQALQQVVSSYPQLWVKKIVNQNI